MNSKEQGLQLGLRFLGEVPERLTDQDPSNEQKENAKRYILNSVMAKGQQESPAIFTLYDTDPKEDREKAQAIVDVCWRMGIPLTVKKDVVIYETPDETGGIICRGSIIELKTPPKFRELK